MRALVLVSLVLLAGCATPETHVSSATPTHVGLVTLTQDRDADAADEVVVVVRALADGDRETRCVCNVSIQHDADGDGRWTQVAIEPLVFASFRSYSVTQGGATRTIYGAEVLLHDPPACADRAPALPLRADLALRGGPVLVGHANATCP